MSGGGRDDGPETLRRAKRYIEANAQADITPADIAAALRVTPRAVQYAFRRHLDTTPGAYLRRVRLARARADLLGAGGRRGDTVGDIAARWRFPHPGRFATAYRRTYGESPSATLHHR